MHNRYPWAVRFWLGLCLTLSGCVTHRHDSGDRKLEIDRLFNSWRHPDTPGAAVVVIKDGTVLYQNGFGCADLTHGIAITTKTVFDVASVSKQFTGLAAAMLVDQGRLSLDDDIQAHLPDLPSFGKPITIRHLLHHTSGLRDWSPTLALGGAGWSDPITMADILRMLRHQRELEFEPGATSLYSNTGYNLLAQIVAKVTGQSFRSWTDENIFRPLAMGHTHFCDDPTEIVLNLAACYERAGKPGYRRVISQLAAPGSSSLMTTAEDMVKWLENLETARVGGRAALQMMRDPGELNSGVTFGYGFGLFLEKYHGLESESHGGGWAGYKSAVLRVPARRFAVAVLSNDAELNAEGLAHEVADCVLGYLDTPVPAQESSTPSASAAMEENPVSLQEYTGVFWSDELQSAIHIECIEGKLLMGQLLRERSRMDRKLRDAFEVNDFPELAVKASIEFIRNQKLEITGLKLSARRVHNLRFERVR
ncbi:MAG: serine hydrolase domain-containing protein [Verrucomicrobiota bacterium]